ncbi:hypothetical protein Tco_0546817 [Tanacetum coccineum]
MTQENKEHFQSERISKFFFAFNLVWRLKSITVDAMLLRNEMWIAIERLQQGESLNVQDVKTNLFWEFGKFTSQDGESMESYYSRFYKLMNELTRNNLQFQLEVNDICVERIAKSANQLAIIAVLALSTHIQIITIKQQHLKDQILLFQKNKCIYPEQSSERQGNAKEFGNPCKKYFKSSTNLHQQNLRNFFKLLRTRLKIPHQEGCPVLVQSLVTCFNCKGYGPLCKGMQGCQSGFGFKDFGVSQGKDDDELEAPLQSTCRDSGGSPGKAPSTGQHWTVQNHNESNVVMTLTKPLNGDRTIDYEILQTKLNETLGLLALKDIEIKEGLKTKAYEISVLNQKHDELVKKSLLTKSQLEGYLKENTKVISDLKVKEDKDIDKMIEMDKQLKFLNEIVYTRNQSIQTIHMLAPKCATYNGRLTFSNPRFSPEREETMTLDNESRSKLNKDIVKPYDYTKQNSLYEIFKAPSLEYLYQLERTKEVRKTMWRKPFVRTRPNIAKNIAFLPISKSISKSRQVFNYLTFNINQFREIVDQTWLKHTSSCFCMPTAHDMELLIKTLLMPLSIKSQNDSFRFEHELKTEMHEDFEYVKSLEKEIDELESEKADFSNIYDLLLEECVSKDVTCSYLHSLSDLNAHTELQCLYLHKVKECECLAIKLSKQTESVNKEVHNNLLKSFSKLEKHSISLELALQQCKEHMKNNSVCKENGSNVFRKEREQYHEIQDLKAQMQDKNIAISELKKLIENCKGKSVETQFDKPSVVRQPNAQRIPKPSVLGKPTPFSNSPEMRSFQTNQSVNKTSVSDGLFNQVTQQNLPQNRKQAEIHSNVLKPGIVSRLQLKCYQVKDKVVPNNSQVKFKKKEVEDHHRISSISKKTKSITACNDSSNSRTSHVNAVCAECGKYVFNSNHDACVSRYLNDVNARTKKPKVVPISASKPKIKANKSVVIQHKKTVASDTTIQKSKSYHKELYENINLKWKWWIAKRCPSGYK